MFSYELSEEDLKDQGKCLACLNEQMEIFNKCFECVKNVKLTDSRLSILCDEINIFHSSVNTILNIFTEEDFCKEDCKNMIYPTLRRMYEKCLKLYYVFHNDTQMDGRYKSYIRDVEDEYRKMFNDLKNNNYQHENLPLPTKKFQEAEKLPNFECMLQKMTNINTKQNGKQYNLSYLYPMYRIMSFYAHGNANKATFEKLFGEKNSFSVIKVKIFINILANVYNVLIRKCIIAKGKADDE